MVSFSGIGNVNNNNNNKTRLWGNNHDMGFGHVEFEVLLRHPRKDLEKIFIGRVIDEETEVAIAGNIKLFNVLTKLHHYQLKIQFLDLRSPDLLLWHSFPHYQCFLPLNNF